MSMTFDPYTSPNSLVDRCDAESDVLMTNPTALAELEAYWHALPRQRGLAKAVPNRTDLDPAALGSLLENMFILERIAPGVARIRVAGRGIGKLIGVEPRGMPLTASFMPKARAAVAQHIEAVFRGPSIVEVSLESPRALGQPRLQGRLLLLPLTDEFGRVSRAVGLLVMSGRRGLGGRRFTITQDTAPRVQPVVALTSIDGGNSAPVPASKKAEGTSALRLVVSNSD